MQKIVFTEEFCQPENLHPFTLTRRLQDIRVGILTIREKWEKWLGLPSFDQIEEDYKDHAHSVSLQESVKSGDCLLIQGNVLPTASLVKAVKKLKNGEYISSGNTALVFRFSQKEVKGRFKVKMNKAIVLEEKVKLLHRPWDIFQLNDWAIREDFALLTKKRRSQAISRSNKITKGFPVFLEKGAKVEHAILNASAGPIYIGKNAEIMEGACIRGPFAIGEGGCVKMGAKIYGATTIGPYCIAGGEIKNTVFFGYSNKAHDGYLGDAVIGEWCNMGAGTTNSNLKNNASPVKLWTPAGEVEAGIKCGVLMGDYTRTAINTSINTGTIIGTSVNVFGNGLSPRYIPSFAWGNEGVSRYEIEKALQDIQNWKRFKGKVLTDNEKSILTYIYTHY